MVTPFALFEVLLICRFLNFALSQYQFMIHFVVVVVVVVVDGCLPLTFSSSN